MTPTFVTGYSMCAVPVQSANSKVIQTDSLGLVYTYAVSAHSMCPTPCAPPHIPYTPPHVPHPIYHMPHPLVYLCPPTVDVIANVSFIVVIETSQCVQSAAVEQHIERHTFKRNGPGSYGRQWSVVPNDVTFSWKTTPCS